jgi:hypothetical protein
MTPLPRYSTPTYARTRPTRHEHAAYPRVCRNGHTIGSIRGEHSTPGGVHRQCRECRLESQRRANERYDERMGMLRTLGKRISANNIAMARDERLYAEWHQEVRTRFGDEALQDLQAWSETPDGLFSDVAVETKEEPSE